MRQIGLSIPEIDGNIKICTNKRNKQLTSYPKHILSYIHIPPHRGGEYFKTLLLYLTLKPHIEISPFTNSYL